MNQEETLRCVLWNAETFAALTPVIVYKPGVGYVFEISRVREANGRLWLRHTFYPYGFVNGPVFSLRRIPSTTTPNLLLKRGIDLNDTGWKIRESDMRDALYALKTLILFRTGEKQNEDTDSR